MPNDADTLYFLGGTLFQMKRYDEAKPILRKFLEAAPDDRRAVKVREALGN